MKLSFIFWVSILLVSCNQQGNNEKALQKRIDSLEANSYRPGFGEFMSSIQIHHSKLWFAGKNQNWKLADFEINEIKENLTDIKKYCADRPETKSIGMIDQSLDSISNAIIQKNAALFNSNYTTLTNTCNACHQATNHEYNVIKIPDNPPFSNQDFKTNN